MVIQSARSNLKPMLCPTPKTANAAESESTMHIKPRKLMLVYQAGIANIFAVDDFHLATANRKATASRVYQGDFKIAEAILHGAWMAGAKVSAACCNMAGDITYQDWNADFDAAPFRESMRLPLYGRDNFTYADGGVSIHA
jgi:hypothetical protein